MSTNQEILEVINKREIQAKETIIGNCPYCNSVVRLHNASESIIENNNIFTECLCCERLVAWVGKRRGSR